MKAAAVVAMRAFVMVILSIGGGDDNGGNGVEKQHARW